MFSVLNDRMDGLFFIKVSFWRQLCEFYPAATGRFGRLLGLLFFGFVSGVFSLFLV